MGPLGRVFCFVGVHAAALDGGTTHMLRTEDDDDEVHDMTLIFVKI